MLRSGLLLCAVLGASATTQHLISYGFSYSAGTVLDVVAGDSVTWNGVSGHTITFMVGSTKQPNDQAGTMSSPHNKSEWNASGVSSHSITFTADDVSDIVHRYYCAPHSANEGTTGSMSNFGIRVSAAAPTENSAESTDPDHPSDTKKSECMAKQHANSCECKCDGSNGTCDNGADWECSIATCFGSEEYPHGSGWYIPDAENQSCLESNEAQARCLQKLYATTCDVSGLITDCHSDATLGFFMPANDADSCVEDLETACLQRTYATVCDDAGNITECHASEELGYFKPADDAQTCVVDASEECLQKLYATACDETGAITACHSNAELGYFKPADDALTCVADPHAECLQKLYATTCGDAGNITGCHSNETDGYFKPADDAMSCVYDANAECLQKLYVTACDDAGNVTGCHANETDGYFKVNAGNGGVADGDGSECVMSTEEETNCLQRPYVETCDADGKVTACWNEGKTGELAWWMIADDEMSCNVSTEAQVGCLQKLYVSTCDAEGNVLSCKQNEGNAVNTVKEGNDCRLATRCEKRPMLNMVGDHSSKCCNGDATEERSPRVSDSRTCPDQAGDGCDSETDPGDNSLCCKNNLLEAGAQKDADYSCKAPVVEEPSEEEPSAEEPAECDGCCAADDGWPETKFGGSRVKDCKTGSGSISRRCTKAKGWKAAVNGCGGGDSGNNGGDNGDCNGCPASEGWPCTTFKTTASIACTDGKNGEKMTGEMTRKCGNRKQIWAPVVNKSGCKSAGDACAAAAKQFDVAGNSPDSIAIKNKTDLKNARRTVIDDRKVVKIKFAEAKAGAAKCVKGKDGRACRLVQREYKAATTAFKALNNAWKKCRK